MKYLLVLTSSASAAVITLLLLSNAALNCKLAKILNEDISENDIEKLKEG